MVSADVVRAIVVDSRWWRARIWQAVMVIRALRDS
jgi:hypothetical protein